MKDPSQMGEAPSAQDQKVTVGGLTGRGRRRSRWASSLAAFRYISSSYASDDVKTRTTDKATNILFMIVVVLGTILFLFPQIGSRFIIPCDVFLGITIIFYIANRLGVISMLTPRQALLISELITGFVGLGIYIMFNVVGLTIWIHELIKPYQH